jgi:CRISPR-associated protein Csb2
VFAIAVELLAGRYTATQFNDRSEAEWPPHPARLYSAMVAAWADSDEPDPVEHAALRWLEEQEAPAIHCGEAESRTIVTHFVPVNDPTALTRNLSRSYVSLEDARQSVTSARQSGDANAERRAAAVIAKAEAKARADAAKAGAATGTETAAIAKDVLAVLPENRGKQPRTYPTVVLGEKDTSVWFVWEQAEASRATMYALDQVLGRVGRLGHSSTLVACRCTETGPESPPSWVPGGTEDGTRLRVPRAGLIDRLELAYETHRGEEPRTLPAGTMTYGRRQDAAPELRLPHLGGDWYILSITRDRRQPFPSAVQALAVTRAVRNALLKHGCQPPAEIISGHKKVTRAARPTPPLDRTHLAIVPLMNAGNVHSDGAVYGVGLVLPRDSGEDDREAVEAALLAWDDAGFELRLPGADDRRHGAFGVEDLGVDRGDGEREPEWLTATLARRRKTTRREYWCRPARRWATVTPVALDRFPGNLRSPQPESRERAEAEARAAVAAACVRAGLADNTDGISVTVRLEAPLAGLPDSPSRHRGPEQRTYPIYKAGGSGTPRTCVHAEIQFPKPVRGPVLIGAGRYLGYGLCLPQYETRPARD